MDQIFSYMGKSSENPNLVYKKIIIYRPEHVPGFSVAFGAGLCLRQLTIMKCMHPFTLIGSAKFNGDYTN